MKLSSHHPLLSVTFLAVLLSCSGDSPTEAAPTPAQVQAMAGSGQTGVAEMPLGAELVARVADPKGRPVAGVTVAWTVAPGAGTLSSTTTMTDSNGEARTQWTLGPAAGTFTVTASAAGLAPATFTATAAPAPPARVEKLGGDGQTGAPAGLLPDSLAVRVVSAGGRPVPGATVAWSVAAGGGTLGAATSATDAGGIAKAAWTLGAAGAGTVTAGVGSIQPVAFTATAVPVATLAISHASAGVGRGDTLRLAATPRDAAGNPLAGRVVKWSSSAPSTASVDEAGAVSGLAYGKATITATSEGQSASATITVTTDDRTKPKLARLSYSPASVDVTSASATVEFTVTMTDAGSGVRDFFLVLVGPGRVSSGSCGSLAPMEAVFVGGTPANGTWKCSVTIPRSAVQGTWIISQLNVIDSAHNQMVYTTANLQSLSFPATLAVINTAPPPAAPKLVGLTFSPSSVDVSASSATVEITASATAGAGVKEVYMGVYPIRGVPQGLQAVSCTAATPASGTVNQGTWKCTIPVRKFSVAGSWTVGLLQVRDSAGITAGYDAEKLVAAGFPGSFQVVSPHEDLTAPRLTAFSVSPTTISAARGSSLDITITAIDEGSGVVTAGATLTPPDGRGGTTCGLSFPVPGPTPGTTLRCSSLGIYGPNAVVGTWTVGDVYVRDAVGNFSRYTIAQLKAAGFATDITVTP